MASKRRKSGLTQQQEEYASWLLLDRRTRQLHSLPLTKTDWAKWKGLNPRTLSRWQGRPTFVDYLEQRRTELARQGPNATVAAGGAQPATDPRTVARTQPPEPAGPGDDPLSRYAHIEDEGYRAYLEAKQVLLEGVRRNDKGAIETYFKLFGKDYIEAEQAGSERLVSMTDDELVAELVDLLGPEQVTAELARRASS